MKSLTTSSLVLTAFLLSAGSTMAASSTQPAAIAVNVQSLEASLLANIQAQRLSIAVDSRSKVLPQGTEVNGISCKTLPRFSKEEGLDDVIRLMALKEVKKSLGAEGEKITDAQLHGLKKVALDKLDNFATDTTVAKDLRDLAALLLKRTADHKRPNLKLYIEEAKKARALIWSRLSEDLKNQIVAEVASQTGKQDAVAMLANQNLLDEQDLDQNINDPQFRTGLKNTVLCFADLQLPDDEHLTVFVPIKGKKVDSTRPLVDVGASLVKLEKDNALLPVQE